MVRRSDGPFHKSRELVEVGIRMRRAGREAAIFRCPRAESYSYINFLDDWMLGAVNTDAEEYTDAGTVWRLPVHGRRFVEGSSIL